MRHHLILAFCHFAVLFFPCSVSVADQIQEIIVTATRTSQPLDQTPLAISILEAQQVQAALPQLGLDESLNRLPGLFLQNRFNFAQDLRISIRGFGARASFGIRGIRIFVDGIPETLADGQGSIDSIDLSSIDTIEVLRGAASSLYGNAAGGVINIESQIGGEAPVLEARVALGEYDYLKSQIKATGTHGTFDYLVSMVDLHIDGYRAHSEARNQLLNMRGRWRIQERSVLNVVAAATRQPLANDPGGISKAQADSAPRSARDRNVQLGAGEDLTQVKLGWNFEHELGNPSQDKISFRNYYSWRDFAGFIPTSDGGIGIDRLFAGIGAMYQTERSWGDVSHTLTLGIDYDRQDDDRTRFMNAAGARGALLLDQNELVENLGVFVQDDVLVNARTSLTLGARLDTVRFALSDRFLSNGDASGSRRMKAVSPMVGVNFAPTPQLNVYANIASSFESPTTTELALINGGLNTALDPQIATNYEVGLRGSTPDGDSTFEINAFYIDVRDELVPFEQADGSDLFVNAGESRRRGLEATWSAALTRNLRVTTAYTYADYTFARFTDTSGNDFAGNALPGIPDHLLQLNIDYRNEAGLFAGLEVQRVGDIPLNNANDQFADSYVLVNIRGGWKWQTGNWAASPFIGINNITATDYFANTRINAFGGRYFEPGPQRNIYGGISVQYQLPRK
ncbi:MAG: TonB-dependent receptor [Gammaproteobacteria bacterium]|nr:TonB-dependent receptor [Gammaproteobacteria bacterium]